MSQKEIEVILTRHLATYLAMPIFVVDPEGALVFYNEPAEALLGCRFEQKGTMTLEEWSRVFVPTDAQGAPLPNDERPLLIAIAERQPCHRDFWLRGLDGVLRHIEVTAFPLIGQAERYLGAVAIFWETQL
jgi:PAS domain-containing protein